TRHFQSTPAPALQARISAPSFLAKEDSIDPQKPSSLTWVNSSTITTSGVMPNDPHLSRGTQLRAEPVFGFSIRPRWTLTNLSNHGVLWMIFVACSLIRLA